MPVTPADVRILQLLAWYYVLTREQIQRLLPGEVSARSIRKRLGKLRRAGYLRKHRVPVALPGTNGAAPVYYPTKAGAELLAAYHDDEAYLATNTRHPRADRLAHWIVLNDTRALIERAVAAREDVTLDGWISEWETINKQAAPAERFVLHTQLRDDPPLSCSPDAAFLLALRGHRKVFYLERDLGTSSPKQIAARKTKGYAALAERQGHRKHFPTATVPGFSVLLVTTNAYRCRATAKEIAKKSRPDLWLFTDEAALTAESFLHAPIFLDHQGATGPLVKPPASTADDSPSSTERPA